MQVGESSPGRALGQEREGKAGVVKAEWRRRRRSGTGSGRNEKAPQDCRGRGGATGGGGGVRGGAEKSSDKSILTLEEQTM